MLKNGKVLFCRCGCGQETARVVLPPGRKLQSIYFGTVTGHEPIIKDVVDSEWISKRVEAYNIITLSRGLINEKRYNRI